MPKSHKNIANKSTVLYDFNTYNEVVRQNKT